MTESFSDDMFKNKLKPMLDNIETEISYRKIIRSNKVDDIELQLAIAKEILHTNIIKIANES